MIHEIQKLVFQLKARSKSHSEELLLNSPTDKLEKFWEGCKSECDFVIDKLTLLLKDESKQPQPPDFANTTLGEVPQVVSVENQEPQQAVEGATPVVRQNEQTKELCLRCHAKEVSISGELWCDSCFRKNLKAQ